MGLFTSHIISEAGLDVEKDDKAEKALNIHLKES